MGLLKKHKEEERKSIVCDSCLWRSWGRVMQGDYMALLANYIGIMTQR